MYAYCNKRLGKQQEFWLGRLNMLEESIKKFSKALENVPMTGILILKDQVEIGRHMWAPISRKNQYSISKSYTATALGMAIEEGLMTLDAPVKMYLEAYWPAIDSVDSLTMERLERLTVRHLVTMTIGHEKPSLMGDERAQLNTDDWISHVLKQAMAYEPGKHFVYTNGGPYLVGVIVEQVTGLSLVDYLMTRLFEPLGIERPEWERDPKGRVFGASGLVLSLEETAKLGQLYLQKGQWGHRRLISEKWVEAATTNQLIRKKNGYGLGFWIGSDGEYKSTGKFGQYIIVLPKKNCVIAINAHNETTIDIGDVCKKTLFENL